MTFEYVPPSLYNFLIQLAEKNKLGILELKTMFIRKVANDLGFYCPHESIGYKDKKPFCKRCWTRLNQTEQQTIFKGKLIKSTEYEPIETFLDQFYSYISTRESKFEHEK